MNLHKMSSACAHLICFMMSCSDATVVSVLAMEIQDVFCSWIQHQKLSPKTGKILWSH